MRALDRKPIPDMSDKAFMRWLYDEFHRLMYATARKYTDSQPVCEDIVQDALEKLIPRAQLLRGLKRCALASYVVSTVRNTAINHLKKQGQEKNWCDSLDDEMYDQLWANAPSLEEMLLLSEQREELGQLLKELPEEDAALLEGKYLLCQTDAELAEALGCKPGSIRMKLTRARRKAFQRLMRNEAGDMV